MQMTTLEGQLAVGVGEVFAVESRPMETAGYSISAALPPGVEQIGEWREPGSGVGSAVRLLMYFRCDRPGEFRIEFVNKRPWEMAGRRSSVSVSCHL